MYFLRNKDGFRGRNRTHMLECAQDYLNESKSHVTYNDPNRGVTKSTELAGWYVELPLGWWVEQDE